MEGGLLMADNKLEVYGLGQFYIKQGAKKIREKDWNSKKNTKIIQTIIS